MFLQKRIRLPSLFLWHLVPVPDGGLNKYSSYMGYAHLAVGLSCGLSCLAAGLSIGIAGDAGMRLELPLIPS